MAQQWTSGHKPPTELPPSLCRPQLMASYCPELLSIAFPRTLRDSLSLTSCSLVWRSATAGLVEPSAPLGLPLCLRHLKQGERSAAAARRLRRVVALRLLEMQTPRML